MCSELLIPPDANYYVCCYYNLFLSFLILFPSDDSVRCPGVPKKAPSNTIIIIIIIIMNSLYLYPLYVHAYLAAFIVVLQKRFNSTCSLLQEEDETQQIKVPT